MKVLELFAGTGSVGKVCAELGYEVVSVDITSRLSIPTHKVDVLTWDYKTYPVGHFDIIWASPPCTTFSTLRRIKKTRIQIDEDIDKVGVPLLRKTEEIINYFQPLKWFIENPQTGRMKDYMMHHRHYDVDYCMYSDWGYRKRTRVWTNATNFEPKRCNQKCGSCTNGKHTTVIYTGGKSTKLLYRVPPDLILSLLNTTP